MKRLLILCLFAACAVPLLPARSIDDPGPWPVGWRDVSFNDTIYGQGTIAARIFYPALSAGHQAAPDPASGPWPVIGFQHGWLFPVSEYDDICTHMASWGFVIASTDTETGLFPDHQQFARDTRSLLAFVEASSADPGSWLHAMADGGDWAAAGHSMGGGALALLIGIEPRVRTIVGLQSAMVNGPAIQNIQAFTGRVYQVAGSVDSIVPPSTVYTFFLEALVAERKIRYLVNGMGHLGCTDNPSWIEPLPAADQKRLSRRIVTGLLLTAVKGEEDLFIDLLGEGMTVEPVDRQSGCQNPPFWAQVSVQQPSNLVIGLGGRAGATVMLAGSFVPDSVPTPYGELGLDLAYGAIFYSAPLNGYGWHESSLPIQPAWSGRTAYFQGLVVDSNSGQLSRVVDFVIP